MAKTITQGTKKGKLSTKPVSTVEDVLSNSLIALDELGWCKGTMQHAQTGAVCALGAIDIGAANHGLRSIHAAGRRVSQDTALYALRVAARDRLAAAIPLAIARRHKIAKAKVVAIWGDSTSIPRWNDSPTSTLDTLKEAFRIALKMK